jgi:hypothetical protein
MTTNATTLTPNDPATGTVPGGKTSRRVRSFLRRCKAAGLSDDPPDDLDQFRLDLARRIAMFLNTWQGCPGLICRRNRGCMAPNIRCSNVTPPTPEERARDWPRVQVDVRRALDARLAELGPEYRDE